MIDLNGPQVMYKGLLKHAVRMVLIQLSIIIKDRRDVQDLGMLSMYSPDSLILQVVVVSETFAVLKFENRLPPFSINILMDLETFPMILKFGQIYLMN